MSTASNLFEHEHKNEVILRIVTLCSEKEESEYVNSLMLSLFSSILCNKAIALKSEYLTLDLLNSFSDSLLTDYYLESVSKLSDKTIEFIESRFVSQNGYRKPVSEEDCSRDAPEMLRLIKSASDNFVDDANFLFQYTSYGSNNSGLRSVELIHDKLCAEVKKHRENRKLLQIKRKIFNIITVAFFTLLLILAFVFTYNSIVSSNYPKPICIEDENKSEIEQSVYIEFGQVLTDSIISEVINSRSVKVNFFHRNLYAYGNVLYEYGKDETKVVCYSNNPKTLIMRRGNVFLGKDVRHIYVLDNPSMLDIKLHPENHKCTLHIPYGTLDSLSINSNVNNIKTAMYDIKEMTIYETWYENLCLRFYKEFHCKLTNLLGQSVVKTPISWLLTLFCYVLFYHCCVLIMRRNVICIMGIIIILERA